MREVLRRSLSRAGRAGRPVGGTPSAILWNVAWLALLALGCDRLSREPPDARAWVGFGFLWAGTALRSWAFQSLGVFYAVRIAFLDDHELVTSGPYRRLRHPLHLGLLTEMTGLALLASGALGWALLTVSGIVLIFRNRKEDRWLETRFGDRFQAHRRGAVDIVDLLPRRRRRPVGRTGA